MLFPNPKLSTKQRDHRSKVSPLAQIAVIGCFLISVVCSSAVASSPPPNPIGLPLGRFHSVDDMGVISGHYTIQFDRLGRLAVVQNGSFAVLNDRNWVYLSEFDDSNEILQSVLQVSSEEAYYGASGAWGKLITTPQGNLKLQTLAPSSRPSWTYANNFLILSEYRDGVCFASWSGLVLWNKKSGESKFVKLPELIAAFTLHDRLFVSSALLGFFEVDDDKGLLLPIDNLPLEHQILYHHTPYNDHQILCATRRSGMVLFDGTKLTPWKTELDTIPNQLITSISRLPEGNFAVAIDTAGLFILDEHGRILMACTTSEFHGIQKIISWEPGILWFSTNSGIRQVFYGSRVSTIDKRQGVPINWPQVASWKGRTIIASNGRLYESSSTTAIAHFTPVDDQPAYGTWGLAGNDTTLLTGNREGVFERLDDGSFTQVLSGFSADRLVMTGEDLCYVIGAELITVIRRSNGEWKPVASRIPGVGYPNLVHSARDSAWIELGVHRVARVSFREGQLKATVLDSFPWENASWIHIGVLDDLVILSSPTEGRLFFDEATESFVKPSALIQSLNHLPFNTGRVVKDDDGNIWASHFQGISLIEAENERFFLNNRGFEFVRASYPIIRVVDGNDIWFNTGSNLYHVNPIHTILPIATPEPKLVSVHDQRSGSALPLPGGENTVLQLDYAQNSLRFSFFAGGYSIRNPRYHFEIEGPFTNWSMTEADSVVNLPNLREGRYRFTSQLMENRVILGNPVSFSFQIAPPWYRSTLAYLAYSFLIIGFFYLTIQWLLHRSRSLNKRLSKLVSERTRELEETMEKLNIKTRHTATLAERDRLACEIHDSVQQGLTGLKVHLDGMLRSERITPELRSNLQTASKMVEFTRMEVQHALLDMESPLLDDADISHALQRVSELIPENSTQVSIHVEGSPYPIASEQSHHLLRICQEAMTNAVRHGKASAIHLFLSYREESFILEIRDDGLGFDPELAIDQTQHFGLRGIRNRAKSIGCELSITSSAETGTSVRIELPMSRHFINNDSVR